VRKLIADSFIRGLSLGAGFICGALIVLEAARIIFT